MSLQGRVSYRNQLGHMRQHCICNAYLLHTSRDLCRMPHSSIPTFHGVSMEAT